VVNAALPDELRGAVPNVVAPSVKVTVPVGVPVPEVGVTTAMKVTLWPKTDGLCEDDSVVIVPVVLDEFTVWVIAVEVLALKLESPE
jgi:hypothetical protein